MARRKATAAAPAAAENVEAAPLPVTAAEPAPAPATAPETATPPQAQTGETVAKTTRSRKKPAPEAVQESKPAKAAGKKPKLIRDSFTFPEGDYALLSVLKQRALAAGREIKKSELLRAGLAQLNAMPEKRLLAALDAVERIKTGRPGKK